MLGVSRVMFSTERSETDGRVCAAGGPPDDSGPKELSALATSSGYRLTEWFLSDPAVHIPDCQHGLAKACCTQGILKAISRTRHRLVGRSDVAWHTFQGSADQPAGDDHKMHRKIVSPAFGNVESRGVMPVFRNVADRVRCLKLLISKCIEEILSCRCASIGGPH